MAIIAENFNSWNESQGYWRRILGVSDNRIRCFPYLGLGHALTDILYGLKEFWPTRRSLGVSFSGSPYLRESVEPFRREGYSVAELPDPRKMKAENWIGAHSKDTLVSIVVRDHGFTGEIITSEDHLAQLSERKLPFIEIQHGWAWSRSQLPGPFGIQIRVIDCQKVLVLFGARVRVHSHSARLMDWSGLDWSAEMKQCRTANCEEFDFIRKFEEQLSHLQPLIRNYHTPNSERLYDRSVMIMPEVSGDFFLVQLLQNLQLPSLAPSGFETRGETTNLARWQGVFPWSWWGDPMLTELEQRSMVILSASFLKQQVNADILNQVYLECLNQTHRVWEKSS
jgi:hypothetical protein